MKFGSIFNAIASIFGFGRASTPLVFNMPNDLPLVMRHRSPPPFGSSRRTVAQDQRRAAKARAQRRAKKHGQA